MLILIDVITKLSALLNFAHNVVESGESCEVCEEYVGKEESNLYFENCLLQSWLVFFSIYTLTE